MTKQPDILVVDDNPNNLAVLSDLLQEIGCQVRVANGGRRGLEAAHQVKPDLILLDITMPDLDGFEVCKALKEEPALADVPVIFLSAHQEALDKVRAFEAGGADYIQKPFQVQEVLARTRLQLNLAALQAELQAKNLSLASANDHLQEALQEAKGLNRDLFDINEKLRQSEELHGRFLAKMRHEINNPLSAILGLTQEILQGPLSPEQTLGLCAMIQTEAFHLDFQIRNVFAAADLEAGATVPAITRVDVDSVLLNVVDAFSKRAAAKSVEVILQERPDPGPILFNTDASMLRIITANLLANAIEFSPKGAKVLLKAALQDEGLLLEIQDQGMGIKEEHQSLIFDRFKQLEEGATRVHSGQGLGLPVTKAMVELMNGRIEVQSQPGEGAVFICRLPPFTVMDEVNTSSFEGNMFIFESPQEI